MFYNGSLFKCTILVCVLAAVGLQAAAQGRAGEIAAADSAFSAYSVAHGTKDAFLKYLDAGGIVFNSSGLPRNGLAVWKKRAVDTVKLRWQPIFAEIDESGTFGYTLGAWAYGNKPLPDTGNSYGIYNSVWRKDSSGNWRVLADIGADNKNAFAPFAVMRIVASHLTMPDATADANSLLALDSKFDKAFLTDKRSSYAQFLDNANLLSRPGHTLFRANGTMETAIGDLPAAITFQPTSAMVSPMGSLGVVYGIAAIGEKRNAYLRIWRHTRNGWKIAAETVLW